MSDLDTGRGPSPGRGGSGGHGYDEDDEDRPPRGGGARHAFNAFAVLLALAVIVGGGYVAYHVGVSALRDRLSPAPDYSGTGSGSVTVQVHKGDSAVDIARTLERRGVVKSVEAFTKAARADAKSVGIQVGFYRLHRQMSAQSALDVLVDPGNLVQDVLTVPEGLRVDQIVDRLAAGTRFSRRAFQRVLDHPAGLGLPGYAQGNAEGYLFPATYDLPPNSTPRSILRLMVHRYSQAVADLDVEARAQALGYDAHDVITLASIVQAEGKLPPDLPKIARVLYNRLSDGMPLQLDTTIVYIFRLHGKLTTTDQERASDSPYNTYLHTGLPPTPIDSPGEAAISAALRPAQGTWRYFVVTNPATGKTAFATTYAQHQANVAKFQQYCRTHDC